MNRGQFFDVFFFNQSRLKTTMYGGNLMISKRVLLAVALLVVSATWAHAAVVNVTGEVFVNVLSIGSADQLNLVNAGSWGVAQLNDPTSIKTYVDTAWNGFAWDGAGITSAVAVTDAGTYAVGYLDNANFGYSTFEGKSVSPTAQLFMATIAGDLTLDGTVDFTDYSILTGNYGMTGAVWSDGDVTHDGVVNFDDYSILTGNYGLSVPVIAPPAAAAAAAVPEPATFVMLFGIAIGAFLFRKMS